MTDDWVGAVGKGHNRPNTWVHPKEWCRRRVMFYGDRGEYGNAYGQLLSDLSRDAETKSLVEKLKQLPYGLEHLRNFIELNLKVPT